MMKKTSVMCAFGKPGQQQGTSLKKCLVNIVDVRLKVHTTSPAPVIRKILVARPKLYSFTQPRQHFLLTL